MGKEKVTIIGSGNWGSAIARIAGNNVKKHTDLFEQEVKIWVFEEEFEGKKLTEIINTEHENRKYLPGVKLPENVTAIPDIKEACKGATALIFVMPHQFLAKTLEQMEGVIPKDKGVKAVTLIKGVHVEGDKVTIFADWIGDKLGVSCSALSGANIATEVAKDKFSETTIGYRTKEDGEMWHELFETPTFKVSLVEDVAGVSLCGALKNIVSVAAGLSDGLEYGSNTKAAIIRIGLLEMKKFCQEFFKDVKDETFLQESAGVADVITSSLGGRNWKCAEAFVKQKKPFDQLEKEMLNGQKLQGIHTAKEIHNFLKAKGRIDAFPLFEKVYRISWEDLPADKLTEGL